jgi:hypothetical protein
VTQEIGKKLLICLFKLKDTKRLLKYLGKEVT